MSSQHDLLRPLSRPHVALHDLQHACDVKVVAGGAVNDISVEGVAVTSHGVVPGDIFVALNGLKTHGARYAPDAIERGAAAILTDQAGVEVLSASGVLDTGIPVLVSSHNESLRRTMAECAAYIYSRPAQHLQIAGITGTNGKTTTAFFLDAIHRAAHKSTALLGTIEMRLGEVSVPSERTTVEAPVLQGFFSRCLEEKALTVTMEVSSHAISLDRITETTFEAVGFTNLQQDHLDFHHTMEEYFAAKAALFTPTYARSGVVVVDDQWGRKLVETASIPVESIMTSLSDDSTYNADWTVTETSVSPQGLGVDFVLRHRSGTTVSSHSPLLGDVNVSNAALATVLALRMGIDEKTIVEGLTTLAAVPGRMEVVSQPDEPLVIVDYAHTAEALDFALASLRNTHHATNQGKADRGLWRSR
ncbi:Mur ligase family protein [Timonella sp. A28]|uniref:Mur ligase family protein n=1 Tax=Timonella sp. A28 TaxID=3442640 RepID=UPI003EBDBBB3